jgi:hypothetical protein
MLSTRVTLLTIIVGVLLAVFVISCSELSAGADPTENCVHMDADSTVMCGDVQYHYY